MLGEIINDPCITDSVAPTVGMSMTVRVCVCPLGVHAQPPRRRADVRAEAELSILLRHKVVASGLPEVEAVGNRLVALVRRLDGSGGWSCDQFVLCATGMHGCNGLNAEAATARARFHPPHRTNSTSSPSAESSIPASFHMSFAARPTPLTIGIFTTRIPPVKPMIVRRRIINTKKCGSALPTLIGTCTRSHTFTQLAVAISVMSFGLGRNPSPNTAMRPSPLLLAVTPVSGFEDSVL